MTIYLAISARSSQMLYYYYWVPHEYWMIRLRENDRSNIGLAKRFVHISIDWCLCVRWMGLCVNGMLSTAIILIWRCWQTTTLTNDGNNTRNKTENKKKNKNVKIVVCLFISVFLSCVVCFPFPSLHLCCIHTHTDRQTDRQALFFRLHNFT